MCYRWVRLGILFCTLLLAIGRAEPVDVLLAAASDAELRPLLARLGTPQAEAIAVWQFWHGTIAGRHVVVARTEGDPLNAVAAVTLGIRHFGPRLVLTFGTARAHDPALRPGDVVASERFSAFDGMETAVAAVGKGSAPLAWDRLPHALATAGEREVPAPFFPADAGALGVALHLALPPGRVVAGVLGSASQVNREADRIAWLHEKWGTSCEDGESAHIAGCAQLLGVPAFGVRVIDGKEGDAAAVVLKFLEAWQ